MTATASQNQYADTTEFQLHQHADKPAALLLSRDGCRRNAEWIPRSLLIEPSTTQIIKIEGEATQYGIFYLKTWKAKELGWIEEADENQLRLV